MRTTQLPEKMTLQMLATVCSKLIVEKDMHRENAVFFNQLFNKHVSADISKKLEYTELQQFYQLRAEYHISQLMRIEIEIEKLDGFASSGLFEYSEKLTGAV